MGLASMFLGDSNPFAQWAGQNQNFLSNIGAGLMQGQNLQNGLQIAGATMPQAKQLDLQQAEKMKAEALKTAQSNYTLKLFQDKGFSDLVDLANAGAPMGELMQEYFKRIQPPAAPEPVKGVEVNNRLVNPFTGAVLADFSGSNAPPPAPSGYRWKPDGSLEAIPGGPATAPKTDAEWLQQYNLYSQQETAAGRKPLPWVEFKKSLANDGVTVNVGENSPPFTKKADELAAARYNDIVTSGQGAQQFMGDLNTLTEIAKVVPTGKEAEIKAALGPYAEMFNIPIEGLGASQAFNAIVARMAPQMRVPGAGASSDFDARQFLLSLPSLGNSAEGNQIIIQTFSAIQEAKIKAAEIADRVLGGEITWQEGDKLIRQLGDPFSAFNAYRAKSKDTGAAPGGNTTSTGITWSVEP